MVRPAKRTCMGGVAFNKPRAPPQQDGEAAGQTVAHVHVHVLPRMGLADFARPDDVHTYLEADDVTDSGRVWMMLLCRCYRVSATCGVSPGKMNLRATTTSVMSSLTSAPVFSCALACPI